MFPSDNICQKALKLLAKEGCQKGFNGVVNAPKMWIFISREPGETGSYDNVLVYVDKESGECRAFDWIKDLSQLTSGVQVYIPPKYQFEKAS